MTTTQFSQLLKWYTLSMGEQIMFIDNTSFLDEFIDEMVERESEFELKDLTYITFQIGNMKIKTPSQQRFAKMAQERAVKESDPEQSLLLLVSTFNMQSNLKALSLDDIREFENQILDCIERLDQEGITTESIPELYKQLAKIDHYDSEIWNHFDKHHEQYFFMGGRQRNGMISAYYFTKRDDQLHLISPEVQEDYERETTVRDFQPGKPPSRSANMVNQIRRIIQQRHLQYKEEHDLDFFVDFAIPELKLAVEINGPIHYISPTLESTATTDAKERYLRKGGWEVLNIPYFSKDLNQDFIEMLEAHINNSQEPIPYKGEKFPRHIEYL